MLEHFMKCSKFFLFKITFFVNRINAFKEYSYLYSIEVTITLRKKCGQSLQMIHLFFYFFFVSANVRTFQ